MQINKLFLTLCISSFVFINALTAQEITTEDELYSISPATTEVSENTDIQEESIEENLNNDVQEIKKNFFQRSSFVLELTPALYLNPSSKSLIGQTSSPIYPFTLGFTWPNDFWISIEPSLCFFTMYHLWYDGTTYPAEPENRTSQTLDFMINIPVSISLFFKTGVLQLTPGFGILARFGLLANGINATDPGYEGTAQADLDKINKWFWDNGRFMYINFGVSYLLTLTEKIKGGPSVHAFIPVGTIFSGESVQGMIISIGMKLTI